MARDVVTWGSGTLTAQAFHCRQELVTRKQLGSAKDKTGPILRLPPVQSTRALPQLERTTASGATLTCHPQ